MSVPATHTITTDALVAIDLSPFSPFVPKEYRFFFEGAPGVAPYRLLAHLSTLFTGQTLVEIGVHNGWGSMALSHNPANTVVGYDIDLSTLDPTLRDAHSHIAFYEGIAQDMHPETLLRSPLIHLDTLHDGVYESAFVAWLLEHDYRGWLLCDDIYLNDAMRAFWAGVTIPKRDLTALGHATGTGLVCFNQRPL